MIFFASFHFYGDKNVEGDISSVFRSFFHGVAGCLLVCFWMVKTRKFRLVIKWGCLLVICTWLSAKLLRQLVLLSKKLRLVSKLITHLEWAEHASDCFIDLFRFEIGALLAFPLFVFILFFKLNLAVKKLGAGMWGRELAPTRSSKGACLYLYAWWEWRHTM